MEYQMFFIYLFSPFKALDSLFGLLTIYFYIYAVDSILPIISNVTI